MLSLLFTAYKAIHTAVSMASINGGGCGSLAYLCYSSCTCCYWYSTFISLIASGNQAINHLSACSTLAASSNAAYLGFLNNLSVRCITNSSAYFSRWLLELYLLI